VYINNERRIQMGFRTCENCTEEPAIAGSDLCDLCDEMMDENALINGMSVEEYAQGMGVRILPREEVR
jgi:hypothetical protein